MKKSIILLFGLFFLTIISCSTGSNSLEKDISSVVDTFFRNYKGDFRTVDRTLLTQDLLTLIDKAIAKELFEAKKMKESNFPSDKPLMIEGDIFTSLYEGQKSFNIREIKIEENKASVTIQFANSLYEKTWEDQVLLMKDKDWKIDNVVFKGQTVNIKSTKEILLGLINSKS